jgi:hypothetical protein
MIKDMQPQKKEKTAGNYSGELQMTGHLQEGDSAELQ